MTLWGNLIYMTRGSSFGLNASQAIVYSLTIISLERICLSIHEWSRDQLEILRIKVKTCELRRCQRKIRKWQSDPAPRSNRKNLIVNEQTGQFKGSNCSVHRGLPIVVRIHNTSSPFVSSWNRIKNFFSIFCQIPEHSQHPGTAIYLSTSNNTPPDSIQYTKVGRGA
nr:hypothetical transcript [Hymenolepis microstoma]